MRGVSVSPGRGPHSWARSADLSDQDTALAPRIAGSLILQRSVLSVRDVLVPTQLLIPNYPKSCPGVEIQPEILPWLCGFLDANRGMVLAHGRQGPLYAGRDCFRAYSCCVSCPFVFVTPP